MKEMLVEFVVYTLAILAGIYLFVEVGNEIFTQIAMLYEGVPERILIPKDSALVHVGVFFIYT